MDSVQEHKCPICMEIMTRAMIIKTCCHTVCKDCGEQLKKSLIETKSSSQQCPVCRTSFLEKDIGYKDYTNILKETKIRYLEDFLN